MYCCEMHDFIVVKSKNDEGNRSTVFLFIKKLSTTNRMNKTLNLMNKTSTANEQVAKMLE